MFFCVFSGHFRLPKCEDLPKHSNSTKTCTKSSITTMRWDLATSKLIDVHVLVSPIDTLVPRIVSAKVYWNKFVLKLTTI